MGNGLVSADPCCNQVIVRSLFSPLPGVCRHTNLLAAVNMVRSGERYGYIHYLLVHKLWPRGVDFVFWDVGCKVRPWVQKANGAIERAPPEVLARLKLDPAAIRTGAARTAILVPHAHGQFHRWPCKV